MIFSPPMQFIKLTSSEDVTVYVNPVQIQEIFILGQFTSIWINSQTVYLAVKESPLEIMRLIAMTNEVPVVMDYDRLAPTEKK